MEKTKFKAEWIRVLQCRSIEDKLAIATDCDLAPVGDLNIVSELVREGILVFLHRTVLPHLVVVDERNDRIRLGINADVYMLTLKGIQLCNQYGIKKQ